MRLLAKPLKDKKRLYRTIDIRDVSYIYDRTQDKMNEQSREQVSECKREHHQFFQCKRLASINGVIWSRYQSLGLLLVQVCPDSSNYV